MWLLKCTKDPVPENPSAVNVLMSPKNSWKSAKKNFYLIIMSQTGLEKVIFSQI